MKALPKSFAASLLIFIMVLQISTPAFAQSTALSQAKEIQACFESVIGKSLSPENLLKVDLGEHKYIDRLAATKAMMIWSLGDFTNQAIQKNEPGLVKLQFIIAIHIITFSGIAGWAWIEIADRFEKYKKQRPTLSAKKIKEYRTVGIVSTALTVILSYFGKDFNKKHIMLDPIEDLTQAATNEEFYSILADSHSEEAQQVRKAIIIGCHLIAEKISYFTDNPDLLVADLDEMRKSYTSPVLLDSMDIPEFRNNQVIVNMPSLGKTPSGKIR